MANQQIKRLLRRRPEIEEAEFELLQSRVLARLMGPDDETDATATEAPDIGATPDPLGSASDGDAIATTEAMDAPRAPTAPVRSGSVATYEHPDLAVGVVAEPGDAIWASGSMTTETVDETETEAVAEPEPIAMVEQEVTIEPEPHEIVETDPEPAVAEQPEPTPIPAGVAVMFGDELEVAAAAPFEIHDPVDAVAEPTFTVPSRKSGSSPGRPAREPSVKTAGRKASPRRPSPAPTPIAPVADLPVETRPPTPTIVTAPTRPRPVRPRPTPSTAAKAPPIALAAPYCPYCALLLDPPPEASRRCPRCRERIIVKRVDGRAIYLTEASVLVFESERRRMANAGRWTRERTRWLKAAAAVDASPDRLAKLSAAPLSEEVVNASRTLYVNTVERSFRTAKRERRWEDASRIMRDLAQVLFRLAGSPIPPPEDVVRAHGEGAAAALRGVGEMSRDAELVSRRCCEICDADDGRTFKIASELRTRRLPHAGCPRGLCRCDWFLAVRDQSMVRRNLRRRARAEVAASSRG